MDIVFDLTEEYNYGVSLSAKYNTTEKVAQRLALYINKMLFQYIQSKEEKNNIPYILSNFEDETQEITHKRK